MKQIMVNLGEDSYPIYVQSGVLHEAGDFLKRHHLTDGIFVITDDNVNGLYSEPLLEALGPLDAHFITIRPGEQTKNLDTVYSIYTRLIELGATRKSVVVALGGGVVGDVAGFVAATYMRGLRFVQIPTTVLAQVDSSVGGKTGVNHHLGKNLIGAFYQPQFVLIDPQVLTTLSIRERRAGTAEVIKYGFIRDRELFDLLEGEMSRFVALEDFDLVEDVLLTCCGIKADVVSQDEREAGLRAILNFGHTLGHALEAATHYRTFLHGEAVAHGMRAALFLSMQHSSLGSEDYDRGQALIDTLTPPTIPSDVAARPLLEAMKKDKKRTSSGQLWVLLRAIGEAVLQNDIRQESIIEAIEVMISC